MFFLRRNEVLLVKKVKKIGKGKWNGYGGEIEPGETQRQACAREVREETGGITVCEKDLVKVADAYFHNTTEEGKEFVCHMATFIAYIWEGEPSSTEEMICPTWFDYHILPVSDMLPADPFWLPLALSGEKIIVKAKLAPHQVYLIGEVEIKRVDFLLEE